MAHIFFEKLEKRLSTQTLGSFGGLMPPSSISIGTYIPYYGASIPDNPYKYQPVEPKTSTIFPFSTTVGFMSQGYPASNFSLGWNNSFNQYNTWMNPLSNTSGEMGMGSFFTPLWNTFQGFFDWQQPVSAYPINNYSQNYLNRQGMYTQQFSNWPALNQFPSLITQKSPKEYFPLYPQPKEPSISVWYGIGILGTPVGQPGPGY